MRSNNEQRPFVLTRAFFAGSQRFGMHFGTLVYFNKKKMYIKLTIIKGIATCIYINWYMYIQC